MFRYKKNLQLFVAIFLLVTGKLYGEVNQNGDLQLWQHLSIEKKLKNAWSCRFLGEMRWGDDLSKLYLSYAQWQAVYTKKCFEIAPGYRQEYFRPNQQWLARYNPMIDITLFFPGKWEWEDRSRIMYHIRERAPTSWIYRNRLRLISPEVTSCFKLKFFIEDEIFFVEGWGFSQNRVAFGLLGTATAYLNGRIYYIYRNLKREHDWTYQNILAFQISF